MAALWQMLREEVRATVDDFREKGAIGTLKDVALDTRDMATSMGGGLINGVKDLVADDRRCGLPVLQIQGVPTRGIVAPLRFEDGTTVQATVVDVDATAQPPRVKVAAPGIGELLTVELLDSSDPTPLQDSHERDAQTGEDSLLDLFVEECRDTVKEIREKGAVSAVRDAAHDAVDILGSTATKAMSSARSLANPSEAVDPSAETSSEATSSSSTAPAPNTTAPTESVNLLDLPLFDTIKQEWDSTVQDVREKGAINAVKDAALDAADIVGSMAQTAVDGAKSIVSRSGYPQDLDGRELSASRYEGSTEEEHPPTSVKKLVEDYEESLRVQDTSPSPSRKGSFVRPSEEPEEFID